MNVGCGVVSQLRTSTLVDPRSRLSVFSPCGSLSKALFIKFVPKS